VDDISGKTEWVGVLKSVDVGDFFPRTAVSEINSVFQSLGWLERYAV